MNLDTVYINLYHVFAKVACAQLLDLPGPLETLQSSVLQNTTNLRVLG